MPRQVSDEVQVAFHDAPTYFSEEEWDILKEWQKELYRNVMKEVHQALLSLGPLIVTTVLSLRTKENQDPSPKDKEEAERVHDDDSTTIFINHLGEEVRRSNLDPGPGNTLTDPDDAFVIKGEENLQLIHPLATERRGQMNDCLRSGEDENSASSSDAHHEEEVGGGTRDPEPGYELNIEIDTKCVEKQPDAYSMEPHELETWGPAENGAISKTESFGPNSRRCTDCDQSFMEQSQLMLHMRIHMKEKAFTCSICGESFNNRHDLIMHGRSHAGESAYKYMEYFKSFTLKSNMTQNHKIHTGEKPYERTEWDKDFNSVSHMKQHQTAYNEERPYQCAECGKSFTQSSNLYQHQKIHTGERRYQCTECTKSFIRRSSLFNHRKIHSGERPFQCMACDKCFTQRAHLDSHLRIHTKEKPYECPVCKKRFSHSCNLRSHQRIHTGEKPYACTECKKSFSDPSSLRKHQIVHAGPKHCESMHAQSYI